MIAGVTEFSTKGGVSKTCFLSVLKGCIKKGSQQAIRQCFFFSLSGFCGLRIEGTRSKHLAIKFAPDIVQLHVVCKNICRIMTHAESSTLRA